MKNTNLVLGMMLIMLLAMSGNLFAQNNCLDFDGTDDYVEVSSSSTINLGTGDFTISLWVNSTLSSDGLLIEKIWDARSSTGGNGWAIQLLSTGRFRFSIADTQGETLTDFNSILGNVWNDGAWHHLAIVVDRDANVSFYIDGNADRTGDVSSEPGNLSNDYPLMIGINYNKNATKDYPFDGLIDEVRIWNDVRTQAEIRANMYRKIPNPTSEANLVAYYQFNETSGTNLPDESSNSNNGTLYNMTNDDWVNSGAFAGPGNCLLFDGVDEYIEVPADPSQNITDAITIEAWVKPGSADHYQNILEKGSYYDDAYALLVKQDIQYIKFSLVGIDQHWGYGPVNLWDGKWHHIAGTYDKNGGSNNTNLYVDGYCVKSETKTGSITSDPSEKIYIGGHSYDGNLFNGPIDEVRLWNTARTSEQIRENMCRTLDGDEGGLVAYYRFDQKNTSGQTTLYDITTNGNHGTLTNMEVTADWVDCEAFDTWIGWLSDSWTTAANWSDGVPTATDNVGIPFWGHSPTVSGNPTVNNIVIGLLATLYLSSDFTINRHYFELGTLSPGTNTVTFGGSSKQYLVGINLGFYNLTINNTHAGDKVSAWWCTSLSVANNLTITDGIFYSKSDYNNVSIGTNGTLELSGNITVSGNWNNSGNFTHNNHKVTFDGSSAQTIQGTNITTFYDLTVNNSSTGVTLSKATNVSNYLLLSSGDIDLNGNTIDLGTTGTLTETGGLIKGTSGYIQATGTLNAPNSVNVGGLGAVISSNEDLGSTVITRGVTAQTGGGHYGIKRYYNIEPTNNSNLNATLVLHYADSELNGITAGNLELFRSTDNGSTWTLRGGTVNTSENTITVTGIGAFSRWTAGDKNNPLPVKLSSFTAYCHKGTVTLNWTTESEINNYGFDVERKRTENPSWTKIGFVEGHGTVNTPQSYVYEDKNLTAGKYNYRLKQIDHNGNYEYFDLSSDVLVGAPSKFNISQNYPNPFNPKTNISFELPNDSKVSIKIFDMLGRKVATLVDGFKEAGYHTVEFDGSNLSSGMYFYRIHTESFEAVKRMLLIK